MARVASKSLLASLVTLGLATAVSAADPAPPQGGGSASLHITDHNDFCVYAPADHAQSIGEADLVSWCTKGGDGSKQVPEGTFTGVTVIKTDKWVQVSGVGDLTKINIPSYDPGAQLSSDGKKPEGASVQVDGATAASWVSLISSDTFCFRACLGDASFCPTDMADQGCYVLLSNAVGWADSFRTCKSDAGKPPKEQGETAPEWQDCWEQGSDPSGGAQAGKSSKGDASKGAPSPTQADEEWVPQETCVPCEGGPEPTAASSAVGGDKPDGKEGKGPEDKPESDKPHESGPTSSATSTFSTSSTSKSDAEPSESKEGEPTSQQGISPVKTDAAGGAKAAEAKPTDGDLLARHHKRQDPAATVTKNGQCCHTTWVPKASATPSGGSSSAASTTSKTTTSGLITAGSSTAAGAKAAAGTGAAHNSSTNGTAAAGATSAGTRNVTLDGTVGNATKNATTGMNGTKGNESSWGLRGQPIPLAFVEGWRGQAALVGVMLVGGMATLL